MPEVNERPSYEDQQALIELTASYPSTSYDSYATIWQRGTTEDYTLRLMPPPEWMEHQYVAVVGIVDPSGDVYEGGYLLGFQHNGVVMLFSGIDYELAELARVAIQEETYTLVPRIR